MVVIEIREIAVDIMSSNRILDISNLLAAFANGLDIE